MMINLFVWFFQCFVLCWWGERKGIWPVEKKNYLTKTTISGMTHNASSTFLPLMSRL